MVRHLIPLIALLWIVPPAPARAAGSTIDLEPPPAGEFVLDRAGLLDATQKAAIEEISRKLLAEHQTPLVVVTINSMADHWPHGPIRIETFAHLLFDQWAIGAAELDGQVWNTGILLLVSRNDRKARIQLGGGWGRDHDDEVLHIMNDAIVPQFKRERSGDGIVAGVRALDAMARGKALPAARGDGAGRTPQGSAPAPSRGISPTLAAPGMSMAPFCCGIVLILALVAFIVPAITGRGGGMFRGGGGRGMGGLGWGAGGLLGGLLLGRHLSGRGGSGPSGGGGGGGMFGGGGFGGGGGGGGFRGGGFGGGGGFRGGGFSGGGGATGKW